MTSVRIDKRACVREDPATNSHRFSFSLVHLCLSSCSSVSLLGVNQCGRGGVSGVTRRLPNRARLVFSRQRPPTPFVDTRHRRRLYLAGFCSSPLLSLLLSPPAVPRLGGLGKKTPARVSPSRASKPRSRNAKDERETGEPSVPDLSRESLSSAASLSFRSERARGERRWQARREGDRAGVRDLNTRRS